MGKSTKVSAPAPDPQIGEAAKLQAQLGMDWLAESRRQFDLAEGRQQNLDGITARVGEQQIAASEQAMQWATQDRARHQGVFQPMQDRFIRDAEGWDSAGRQAAAAAEARADVLTTAAAARETGQRQAAAMGINPTSGRYQGMERAGELATGLAAAGAQNNARSMVRQQGMALRGEALNMGNGLAMNPGASMQLGLGAGQAALAGAAGANASARGNLGILQQGYQTAMGGYQQQANILGAQDQRSLAAWQTQVQANAQNTAGLMGGIGSIFGTVGGLGGFGKTIAGGMALLSSKEAKEDKRPVSGALGVLMEMLVEEWTYKPGMGDGGRRIGPYAEDFHRLTGKGDGRTIPVVDAIGITMKATQELAEEVRALRGALPVKAKTRGRGVFREVA